jgi:hypothetical protein
MNGIQWLDPLISSSTHGGNPFWRGTSIESADLTLVDAVGFEADEIDLPDDNRGSAVLAAATLNVDGKYVDDNGQDYTGNGNLSPWGIVMHQNREDFGVVVGFGTMAWAWMLSDVHRDGENVSLVQCQQATVNLLKDLGVSAASLRTAQLIDPVPVELSSYGMTVPKVPSETRTYAYGGKPLLPYVLQNGELVALM